MANLMKFTSKQVTMMINHTTRMHHTYANSNIDKNRTKLNYSIPIDHDGLSPKEYFQKMVKESYLYGRGTKREKTAVTAASWVITAPKEIVGFPDKEEAFFQAVTEFVSKRYGYTILSEVHYDEGRPKNPDHPNPAEWIGGAPHVHILFLPITPIDHEQVHYKTVKTKSAIRLESGRYEYQYRFKLDENGQKIPLKNYAKASDQYDMKISADQVLNKVELQFFHKDLGRFLWENNIDGAVYTGVTGDSNYSIKQLKEFTNYTGLTLDQVRELMPEKNILESIVRQADTIEYLQNLVLEKNMTISHLQTEITDLTEKVHSLTLQMESLEKQQTVAHDWGSSSWGKRTRNQTTTIHFEEDNL